MIDEERRGHASANFSYTALVICVAGLSAYGKKNPKEVQKKVEKSMAVESGIQKAADDWNWDKQRIIQEIRDLKYLTTWLKYRQEKNCLYKAQTRDALEMLDSLDEARSK